MADVSTQRLRFGGSLADIVRSTNLLTYFKLLTCTHQQYWSPLSRLDSDRVWLFMGPRQYAICDVFSASNDWKMCLHT